MRHQINPTLTIAAELREILAAPSRHLRTAVATGSREADGLPMHSLEKKRLKSLPVLASWL